MQVAVGNGNIWWRQRTSPVHRPGCEMKCKANVSRSCRGKDLKGRKQMSQCPAPRQGGREVLHKVTGGSIHKCIGSPLLTAAKQNSLYPWRPPATNQNKDPKTKTTKNHQNTNPTPNQKNDMAGTTGTRVLLKGLKKGAQVGTMAVVGALSPKKGNPRKREGS